MTTPTEEQIEAALHKVLDSDKRYSGQTYEEGIRDALDWVLGNTDTDPSDEY